MENTNLGNGPSMSDTAKAYLKGGEKKLAEHGEAIRKEASDLVASVVDKVTPLAKEQFDAIKDRSNRIIHGAEESIRSHPFVAVGIAAAVGGFLGLAVWQAARTSVRS